MRGSNEHRNPSPPPARTRAAARHANLYPDVAKTPWYKTEFYVGRAVKAEEVMNFSRQASSFLRAGVPILDALAVVGEENASKKMQEVLADIQLRLRSGSSFGDAIAQHTKVFPGYYIAVVRAAELTGRLDDALDQLAEYLEREVDGEEGDQEPAHVSDHRVLSRDRRRRRHVGLRAAEVQGLLHGSGRATPAADADAARLHQLHVGLLVGPSASRHSCCRRRRTGADRRKRGQGAARHAPATPPRGRRTLQPHRRSSGSAGCSPRWCRPGSPFPDAVQVSADSTNNSRVPEPSWRWFGKR